MLKFKSAVNNQDYVLKFELPGSYSSDTTRKYQVFYALDGQWSFSQMIGITGSLRYDGFIPEMILVGITWPDNYDANRTRDFSPTHIRDDSASGGAPKFLSVVKQEIISLINSSYHTDPTNNILAGGSFGGLFALYVLFLEPTLFKYYMISSPSLDYDDGVTFRLARALAQVARVFRLQFVPV